MSVYIIRCKDKSITDCYIGSTNDIENRKQRHKTSCCNENDKNRSYNLKVYKYIRNNGGWDNWEMVKICDVNKDISLREMEQYYIDFINPSLNSRDAIVDEDYDKNYTRRWRIENPEKEKALVERGKERINCEYCSENISRGSYLAHKRRRHWGITNYKKEKKWCDICDKEVSVSNLARHRKIHK
jgi:hypothetical protein